MDLDLAWNVAEVLSPTSLVNLSARAAHPVPTVMRLRSLHVPSVQLMHTITCTVPLLASAVTSAIMGCRNMAL